MASQPERNGESIETAIIIEADSTAQGIPMEYAWLEEHFGERGRDWEFLMQALLQHEERSYDRLDIRLADGTDKSVYFDITSFFGKF